MRTIDREKIIGRVKRALRNKKEHVSRVYFDPFDKKRIFYRIGPGNFHLKVQKTSVGFRVFRTPEAYVDLSPTR